ncbi:hypothetical protein WJX73_008312 [Symbiochloris irregularis]|uniref:Uncharacterized protein n=1 Tax=Symbiochloris irregularis TaxID=706552 RepID=A0AAW1NWU5_9CHLO
MVRLHFGAGVGINGPDALLVDRDEDVRSFARQEWAVRQSQTRFLVPLQHTWNPLHCRPRSIWIQLIAICASQSV